LGLSTRIRQFPEVRKMRPGETVSAGVPRICGTPEGGPGLIQRGRKRGGGDLTFAGIFQ